MNIAICDDEPTICKEIKNCIMSASSGVTCDFYEFHSGDALSIIQNEIRHGFFGYRVRKRS